MNLNLKFNSIEELTELFRRAINSSVVLEGKRKKEGWSGDHAQNVAVYICKKYGVFGYSI